MITRFPDFHEAQWQGRQLAPFARWLVEESPSLEDVAATACSFVEQTRGSTEVSV